MRRGAMHGPAQVQVVFEEWVSGGGPWRREPPFDRILGQSVPTEGVLRRLRTCEDVMPPRLCGALGLADGATYADGVEALASAHGPLTRT
jgi:hypothetical protein